MPHPARVYADESYGDNNSFIVQTAIALPAGNAEDAFNEILEAKIAENPRFDREEFKAQGLSDKNRFVFQWFLQQTFNILGEIADRTRAGRSSPSMRWTITARRSTNSYTTSCRGR